MRRKEVRAIAQGAVAVLPQTEYASMNIYQKLQRVQRAVDVLQNNAKGYNYTYISEDAILTKINDAMDKYGLYAYPYIHKDTFNIEEYRRAETKKAKDKSEYQVEKTEFLLGATLSFVIVNTDAPEERIEVPWHAIANGPDSSMAFGSAMTYCNRYFYLKFFRVATVDDDPDAVKKKQQDAIAKQELDYVKAEIDNVVQNAIASDKKMRSVVMDIVKPYIDDGNYFNIKKIQAAKALLKELKDKFESED